MPLIPLKKKTFPMLWDTWHSSELCASDLVSGIVCFWLSFWLSFVAIVSTTPLYTKHSLLRNVWENLADLHQAQTWTLLHCDWDKLEHRLWARTSLNIISCHWCLDWRKSQHPCFNICWKTFPKWKLLASGD